MLMNLFRGKDRKRKGQIEEVVIQQNQEGESQQKGKRGGQRTRTGHGTPGKV